jgi:NDP-sugar pyrophosphorylase family protein
MGLRSVAIDAISTELAPVNSAVSGVGQLRSVLFLNAAAPDDVPVPADYPAALLPYGHSSLVEHTLDQLSQAGVKVLDLVVSTRPEDFRQLLGQGERWGMTLRWHLAKDAATPYSVLKSLGLTTRQRVLIGHADRLIADAVLSALIASDQMAATAHEQQGFAWAGWGSTTTDVLRNQGPHSDESALGSYLCAQTEHLLMLDASEFTAIQNAQDLLKAQQRTLTDHALTHVPATWLTTAWGAHSPDAVIQPGAHIDGPALVGPGCFVAAGARIGAGTVLAHDVVVSKGASVSNSLVLPHTFVGQALELDQTIVNGTTVQHLRLGVRTVLPASDGLLLSLQNQSGPKVSWLVRGTAGMACLLLLPLMLVDGALRLARRLPPRWQQRQVVLGRDASTQAVRLQTMRCASSGHRGLGKLLAHYGEWLDVLAGTRSWFGARPRSPSEWYALGYEWQLLLSNTPVGCLHTAAWSDEGHTSPQALAAADVYFAVNRSMTERMRILGALLTSRTLWR